MYLNAFGCTSAAGGSATHLWNALAEGKICSQPLSSFSEPLWRELQKGGAFPDYAVYGAPLDWSENPQARGQALLQQAWQDLRSRTPQFSNKIGIILASTKGYLSAHYLRDVLADIQTITGLKPTDTLIVSEACSSTAVALDMAYSWLNLFDQVLVVSVDVLSPFVIRGFHCLKALTTEQVRPFDTQRSGLGLGEAAAFLLLSKKPSDFQVSKVGICCSGTSATRPESGGESTKRALQIALEEGPPDVMLCHGTGTLLNDKTETLAVTQLFKAMDLTASKWCIGHTLGVSAAMDLIAAVGMIQRGLVFPIATCQSPEGVLKDSISTQLRKKAISRVLISSLGFGGVHAGFAVSRS